MFTKNLIVEPIADQEGFYWVCPDLTKMGSIKNEKDAENFLQQMIFEGLKRKDRGLVA